MLTALSTLSKAFLDICLLRKGPQDLPQSSVLLSLCLILYTVINVLLTVQSRPFADALLVSFVFYGFIKFGQTLAKQGVLEPFAGVWLGNAVFFLVSIVLIAKTRK